MLPGNSGKENGLRSFGSLEVFDIELGGAGSRLEGGLDQVSLGLGLLDFLFGEFDELLEDELRDRQYALN